MAFEKFPYSNFHDLNLDWIIEQVKQWAVEWAEVKAAYEQFDGDLTDITEHLSHLDSKYAALSNDIAILRNDVNNIENAITDITTELRSFEAVTINSITNLDNRVTEIEDYADFYMYSPFTGDYVPLADVITQLSYFHLNDAITAGEYDALELEALTYDNKQLTAIQYDATARQLLP